RPWKRARGWPSSQPLASTMCLLDAARPIRLILKCGNDDCFVRPKPIDSLCYARPVYARGDGSRSPAHRLLGLRGESYARAQAPPGTPPPTATAARNPSAGDGRHESPPTCTPFTARTGRSPPSSSSTPTPWGRFRPPSSLLMLALALVLMQWINPGGRDLPWG